MDLLAVVSGFLEITDPRSRHPFSRDEPQLSLAELVESFVGTPYAETTAALMALRAMVTDEMLATRIGREIAARRHPMPTWLTGLDQAQVEPDVWFLTHVLGDGANYFIGVALPTGHALSALVYVDHNLGGVVKDAFVVPEPVAGLVNKAGTLIDNPAEQSLTRVDPATARAEIEAAIGLGVNLYPPLTSDSWPMARPLVEWMVRLLPVGGVATDFREWSEQELSEIAAAFFSSPFGSPVEDKDARCLLDSVLWFSTGYATGDPYRWSLVTVELLLVDWFPRKVIADPAYLAKLPNLLRAYIRYCHDRRGIGAHLTADTLAAVDRYEQDYLQLINSDRQRVMSGLASALLESERIGNLNDQEIRLEYLADDVGGVEELMTLTAEPLPDEEFDWAGIPDGIAPTVWAILTECDSGADAVLDVEHRTAMRRFLARAAAREPALFRRKGSPVRGAAAVAWVIASANHTIGGGSAPLAGKDLLAHFGITGSVSDRAQSLIRAAGIDPSATYGAIRVGDPGLLISRRRAALIRERDQAGEMG